MVALQMLLVAGALGGQPEAVLLSFTQASCPPCRAMEPVLAQVEAHGLAVQSIPIDKHPEMAQRFNLKGTPTYVMVVEGRETGRIVGVTTADKLQALYPDVPLDGEVRGQSPDSGSYLNQRLAGVFGKGAGRTAPAAAPPAESGDPFTRRQIEARAASATSEVSSAPAAPSPEDLQARAMAATVRLKIEEPQGYAIGTGTIVGTHGDEAVLVTCAHVFRASKGKGRIQVEVFHPQPATLEGKLLDYDLERDIAVVSITPGPSAVAASVGPQGVAIKKGDAAFSIGCDRGADPTLRDSKITSLNRYVGPPNIEAAGEPTIGRSGGGLFSGDGCLIGVCNCADAEDNEGIYAALATIHWQLEKVGLGDLYQSPPAPAPIAEKPSRSAPPMEFVSASPRNLAGAAPPVRAAADSDSDDTEIICIVRSKSNPSAKGQVVVVPRASQQLLQQIAVENGDPTAAADLALTADRRSSPLPLRENGPLVRGQSKR
jgi:thiol-disulfide isomerase/thioredoxin